MNLGSHSEPADLGKSSTMSKTVLATLAAICLGNGEGVAIAIQYPPCPILNSDCPAGGGPLGQYTSGVVNDS